MLFLVISCFSFIMLSQFPFSFTTWKSEMRIFSFPWFSSSWFKTGKVSNGFFKVATFRLSVKKALSPKLENNGVVQEEKSLLDLPDLALECILEKLSPVGLTSMAGVCSSLRDMCTSDHLWEKHVQQKWGRLIGHAAYREWQWQIASKRRQTLLDCSDQAGFISYLPIFWPLSRKMLKLDGRGKVRSSLPVDSIMAWYLSIESGTFWFPAQVYNRESFMVQNGQVGFVLSCYDAEISYNSCTNNFKARYSSDGRSTMEHDIEWNRLRAPAVDTPARVLHASDCLYDLNPGDHIEIQWRRNKDFPYGWWYGVVGHMEPCNGNKLHCQCHSNEKVLLEFKQYAPGSPWRETIINRKDHNEVGNEADGFYGGIRKIYNEEEISMWQLFWPKQTVQ